MRIGMLADVYKPHISGITNYISLNKHYLEQQGHEVFVFTFGDENYPDDEPNIIRSRGLPLVDTGYYLSFSYQRFARKLLYTMDLVHVHHPFLSGSLAIRYCQPRGIPIVFTNHTRYDLYAQAYLPVLPDVIGETFLQAYLPTFCRNCDLAIAPSNGMKEVMRTLGVISPIEVAPNGVNLEPFKTPEPEQAIQALRADLGAGPEDVVLIYVGRLGPEKNLPFLLRSFAGAAEAYNHLRLIFVGDGPERDNLEDRARAMGIEESIRFTGLVDYSRLPRFLQAADAFVTASVTEVHPLSVIEALASGRPVLGVHSPGISDTIEDGVTGFLAKEDLAAFTAKMVRLVTNHEERKEMGIQAQKAAEKYAIERTTQRLLTYYLNLVEGDHMKKRDLRQRMQRLFDRVRA